jgi:hypothetical protein
VPDCTSDLTPAPQSGPTPTLPAPQPKHLSQTKHAATIEDSTPEQDPAPMLDVHPPHHAANTWRDFFIHIATIVVGLCIAVGIEQTVEYIHHRHQLKEARLALAEEKQANLAIFHQGVATFEEARKSLRSYAAAVQASIQNPANVVPAFPPFSTYKSAQYTAWTTAQRSGALTLMPEGEQTKTDKLYADLRALNEGESKAFADLMRALTVFSLGPNPRNLTQDQKKTLYVDLTQLTADVDQIVLLESAVQFNDPDFQYCQPEFPALKLTPAPGCPASRS